MNTVATIDDDDDDDGDGDEDGDDDDDEERAREAAGPTGLIAVTKILPRAAAGAPRLLVLTSAFSA